MFKNMVVAEFEAEEKKAWIISDPNMPTKSLKLIGEKLIEFCEEVEKKVSEDEKEVSEDELKVSEDKLNEQ